MPEEKEGKAIREKWGFLLNLRLQLTKRYLDLKNGNTLCPNVTLAIERFLSNLLYSLRLSVVKYMPCRYTHK